LVILLLNIQSGVSNRLHSPVTLIFALHGGRSGSSFLNSILHSTGKVRSLHKPDPRMNGEVVDMLLQSPLPKTYSQRADIKLRGLDRQIEVTRRQGLSYYAETTSMFIKTFYDVVMDKYTKDEYIKIILILLRRPIVDLVMSQYELQWLRGEAELSRRFDEGYYSVDQFAYDNAKENGGVAPYPNNKTLASLNADALRIDALIAYNLDVEMKAQALVKKWKDHPRVKIVEVYVEDLIDKNQALKFLEKDIGIKVSSTEGLVNKINSRPPTIFKHGITLPRTAIRFFKFIDTYRKYKLGLPEYVDRFMPNRTDFEDEMKKREAEEKERQLKLPFPMTWKERQIYLETGVLPNRTRVDSNDPLEPNK